jgi:hypothetical protein
MVKLLQDLAMLDSLDKILKTLKITNMSKIIQVQQVLENEFTLQEAKNLIVMHKGETYTFFDEGCTRHVFVNEDHTKVIKLLQRETGKDYNEEENEIYENASDEVKEQMAETSISNGLIEQEFVTPIKFGGKKLTIEQRLFALSCRNEVGWTEDGRLLCFDLDEFKKY